MRYKIYILVGFLFLLSACNVVGGEQVFASAATITATAPPLPTASATPQLTPTTQPTETTVPPTETAVKVKVMQGPGNIICPILLYHRIVDLDTDNPYVLSIADFKDEMKYLDEEGYQTITVTQLVKAINFGAKLPPKPIVITFDDGDITVFSNAAKIMQKHNFVGTAYLVGNYLGADGYMSADQIKKLAADGWEFGSHSLSHTDMRECKFCEDEVVQSKAYLVRKLGITIETFAYPFGYQSEKSSSTVRQYYRAAVGLGASIQQGPYNLFYLWRRPIDNGTDLETFSKYIQ